MDGNSNFKSLGSDPLGRMNIPVTTPLNRQGSIYSWILDQIQNNLRKDYGSMNMEELLKNIYSAEATQGMVSNNGSEEALQRQGSITLPRKLSQKTVDEVWKYITEEEEHTTNDGGRKNIHQIQRQQTLGDITLEEILIRAGAMGNNHNGGYIYDGSSSISGNRNTNLSGEFQHNPMFSHIVPRSINHGSNFHPNLNGSMPTYQPRQQQQQQQNQLMPQQPIMTKPHGYGYESQLAFRSGQTNNHGVRDSFMGIRDQMHQENNISLVPRLATIPSGAMNVDTCSPTTPFPLLDGIQKINVGASLVSPFPYIISGSNSVSGWKKYNGIDVENKVVEKIQKRKIKNRESAARSQARKQAQTMELENEVEKLRKENEDLLRRQAELSRMQTKPEMINLQGRPGKQLRRTKSDIK